MERIPKAVLFKGNRPFKFITENSYFVAENSYYLRIFIFLAI